MSNTRIPVPSYFLLFFGVLAAIVPFAIDAYIPAIPTMAELFDVDINRINQTIVTFLIGYGIGQFFGGPFSDQVGRKTVALSGMIIFLMATLGIIFTLSIEMLLILRFVQALGGGLSSVIGMASIRDVYPPHEAGRKFAVVMMIMLVMPLIAPFIGTALLGFGWQSIFVALFAFVFIAGVWYYFGIPETRVVEEKRLNLRRVFTQISGVLATKTDEGSRPVYYVFCMSFTAAVLLIFVSNSSYLYMEYFGVSEVQFPFYFGSNVVLMGATIMTSMRLLKTVHPHRLFIVGNAVQLIMTLALLVYVVFFTPQLEIILAFMVLCVGTMGLVSPNASAYYISHFDELSGSATSFNNMCVLLVGGISGGLVGYFIQGSILPIAIGMAACSLLSNVVGWSLPKPQGPFKKA
jgi:DHA1 family bicyclomycin/chloramphenicol resistance-like MFS transporter